MMKSPTPTVSDFDELLGYLPLLYDNEFKAIPRWREGGGTDVGAIIFGLTEYDEVVEEFFETVAKECWADHNYDVGSVGKTIRDPRNIANATLQEIKSMLTWCVRGERFNGGHWASVIKVGYICSILLRLQELRPKYCP